MAAATPCGKVENNYRKFPKKITVRFPTTFSVCKFIVVKTNLSPFKSVTPFYRSGAP